MLQNYNLFGRFALNLSLNVQLLFLNRGKTVFFYEIGCLSLTLMN